MGVVKTHSHHTHPAVKPTMVQIIPLKFHKSLSNYGYRALFGSGLNRIEMRLNSTFTVTGET